MSKYIVKIDSFFDGKNFQFIFKSGKKYLELVGNAESDKMRTGENRRKSDVLSGMSGYTTL